MKGIKTKCMPHTHIYICASIYRSTQLGQALGDSKGQGDLAGCSPWGGRVRHDLGTKQQHSCTQQQIYTYIPIYIHMHIYIPIYTHAYSYIYTSVYAYSQRYTYICCFLVIKSCLTLWDPMDCGLPGSSVHGIAQARIPEWVSISFSSTYINIDIFMYIYIFVWVSVSVLCVYSISPRNESVKNIFN